MSKKVFTPEKAEMLRDNKYIFAVTPHILSFTKEFKELFWEEYQSGAIPRQILEQYGHPADILGKERIWGIAHTIKKQYHSPRGLREVPCPDPGSLQMEMPRLRRSVSISCRKRWNTSGRKLSF